jgi:hypothetical protein
MDAIISIAHSLSLIQRHRTALKYDLAVIPGKERSGSHFSGSLNCERRGSEHRLAATGRAVVDLLWRRFLPPRNETCRTRQLYSQFAFAPGPIQAPGGQMVIEERIDYPSSEATSL